MISNFCSDSTVDDSNDIDLANIKLKNFMLDNTYNDVSYPALQFERVFNLHDIGVQWVMPDGRSMSELDDEFWRQDGILDVGKATMYGGNTTAQQMANIYKKTGNYISAFNSLNPELKTIQFDQNNWEQVLHFLDGVVSGFNTDDISEFIHTETSTPLLDNLNKRIIEQYYKLASKSWYPAELREVFNPLIQLDHSYYEKFLPAIRWKISSKTIKEINAQLDNKKQPPQLASRRPD